MNHRLPLVSLFSVIVLLTAGAGLNAQVLPVGTPLMEEFYRREQLLGRVDSSLSFAIRPLSAGALQRRDVYAATDTGITRSMGTFANGQGLYQFLPVSWLQQVNTGYPYGANDGSMIPARGYQTQASAGIFASYKFLSVQFRPEMVWARNNRFGVVSRNIDDGVMSLRWHRAIGNVIDMPERFGAGSYQRFFPGQSSVRFNWNGLSAGLSTENLWWGPGRRNSLLMTNSAPGFLHATLNTTKPIRTSIGSFEAQFIAGRLDSSGFEPTIDSIADPYIRNFHTGKTQSSRYMSGFVFSYQPKWLPGLHLGFIRTAVMYRNDMSRNLRDLVPFFTPVKRVTFTDPWDWLWENENPRSQYRSLFFRWVMPRAQFEVYGEYGRSDRSWNGRDWMVQPDHSRAYVLGFTKLIPLPAAGSQLEISAEATELAATTTRQLRYSPSWYTHKYVRHGYTQLGQVLGAGIGPGSNVQTVEVSWVRGLQQVGLRLERLVHNEDFFHEALRDARRNWTDLGAGIHARWDFGPLLAAAGVQYMHAYNYQYDFFMEEGADFWDNEPQDNTNFSLQLGLTYRFGGVKK